MGGRHPDDRQAAADVVVWEADGRAGKHGYGHPIARRLRSAGWSTTTVRLTERPPNEIEMTAPFHVLSGGETAADADVPWLQPVRDRLRWVLESADAGRASVVGICFGAQLIAHVLGGDGAVGCHPAGLQAGLVELSASRRKGAAGVVSSFHYHSIRRAAIQHMGGKVVLSSALTDVQAFSFGANVYGVQFHPELSPRLLRTTLRSNRRLLEHHGVDPSATDRSIRHRRRDWSDVFLRRFVLRPAACQLIA